MSTLRGSALARASDALRGFRDAPGSLIVTGRGSAIAEVVVDAIYPVITEARQMSGVPEGSLLITDTRPHATVYLWAAGALHELVGEGLATVHVAPVWAIMDEGPLTVVWMP